jgi:hypothetical protein
MTNSPEGFIMNQGQITNQVYEELFGREDGIDADKTAFYISGLHVINTAENIAFKKPDIADANNSSEQGEK